jgi:quercetin dioxygenase-like cupin family protein
MQIHKLDKMIKGWFVGNFEPTIIKTNNVEVAVKKYKAGDYESAHYHKIATEITVIVSGEVEMNGARYVEGDIITILPNEATDFRALKETVTTVVKYPGAGNDKYLVEKKNA